MKRVDAFVLNMMLRTPAVSEPPTRESFHLGNARRAYVEGRIALEKFEDCVDVVLAGGHLYIDFDRRRIVGDVQ